MRNSMKGFSLLEVIIAFVIVGIMSVSALPAFINMNKLSYKTEVSLKPWIQVPSVAVLTPVVIEDPEGDDYGPGYYTYPTDPVFKDGDFDLLKFELGLYEGSYTATYTVGNLDNAWGSDNGLSKATYFLFIDNKQMKAQHRA